MTPVMPPVMADEELMLAVGCGDRLAFEELVARHRGGLYAFFRRRGLDRHAAEDCVQDALMRLLDAAGSYAPRAPFGAFLARLARNALVDWRRRRRAIDTPLPDDGRDEPPPGTRPTTTSSGLPASDRLDLAHAVRGLSSKLRDVVELSVRDGYSHVEIARLLGVPHGTVKTRMHWAVRKLRAALCEDAA